MENRDDMFVKLENLSMEDQKAELLKWFAKIMENDIRTAEEEISDQDWDDEEEKEMVYEYYHSCKGRKEIAGKLLASAEFVFDGPEEMRIAAGYDTENVLTPKTFVSLLMDCNGTKEDLLDIWGDCCGYGTKNMAEMILADYTDVI